MSTPDDWPNRIIDCTPAEKVQLFQRDPDRYMRECRDQRHEEAVRIVAERMAAARRGRRSR